MKQMKLNNYILSVFAVVLFAACSDDDESVGFALDRELIQVGATGSNELVQVASSDEWIASTDNTWISISPANGKGSTPCTFRIDSALTAEPRRGVVRIQNLRTWESREIAIEQAGYPYQIEIDQSSVEVSNYKAYGERYFEITVASNVDFTVKIPDNATWLTNENYKLTLNKGIRPRKVTIRFNWGINSSATERLAEVQFLPKTDVALDRHDVLNVKQQASEPIIADTRAGDSVALLCISRNLGTWTEYDTSTPISSWSGIELWEDNMEGCTPEKVGRVKRAEFFLFGTKESLPYEVRYLTAAEELYFFSNVNSFLRTLSTGDDIAELTQLKRLTIAAYGLTEVSPKLKELKNLEYLDLSSNNFQKIPDVLTRENFPKLRSLVLNANNRSSVYDLSNSVRTDLGGFIEEKEFPADLLKWGLDTLVLGVNYLQGTLPDFKDDPEVPYYTQEDINAVDTLPQFLVDKRVKKIMTTTKFFSINANRLSGALPDWLLYHPALDWWYPDLLIWSQEGRAQDGTQAGFSNTPPNMNYYYDIYTAKSKPLDEEDYD